jgi:glutathione S-transferase
VTLANIIDEITHRAPARLAIRTGAIRKRIAAFWTQSKAALERIHRAWQAASPWLAGTAFVLAYLVICAWLDRADLRADNAQLRTATTELERDKAVLETRISELIATRTRKLVYLIEADTTSEAKDKLARLAMLVAAEHFDLQEATKEVPKK